MQEVNNLMSAMEKPEFAKLFREYLDEINDPKHREENELYLRQLEREQREGLSKNDPLAPKPMEIVIPHEEFCFKTKTLDKPEMRVYINVCSSDRVDKFKDEKGKNETGKGVKNGWRMRRVIFFADCSLLWSRRNFYFCSSAHWKGENGARQRCVG